MIYECTLITSENKHLYDDYVTALLKSLMALKEIEPLAKTPDDRYDLLIKSIVDQSTKIAFRFTDDQSQKPDMLNPLSMYTLVSMLHGIYAPAEVDGHIFMMDFAADSRDTLLALLSEHLDDVKKLLRSNQISWDAPSSNWTCALLDYVFPQEGFWDIGVEMKMTVSDK